MLPGVIRTRVGYTGGSTRNPTYYNLGDHTETFQVDFDPTKTSYEKILEVYWNTHNHCAIPNNRQYMSAVFVASEEQRKIAMATGMAAMKKRGQNFTTFVLPLGQFYLAEGYHQKYYLRQRQDLMRDIAKYYPVVKDFLNSTAATRLNGYVAGHGSYAELQKEIDSFGLSPQGRTALLSHVKTYGRK